MLTSAAIMYDPVTYMVIGFVVPDFDDSELDGSYLPAGVAQKIVTLAQVTATSRDQRQVILWNILGIIPFVADAMILSARDTMSAS